MSDREKERPQRDDDVIREPFDFAGSFEELEARIALFVRKTSVPVELRTHADGRIEVIINNCK